MLKQKPLIIVAVLIIALTFFAVLLVASATENYLFTENLTMSQPEYRNSEEAYIVNMTKGDTHVGVIYLRISGYRDQTNNSAIYYLTLQVPYQTGIEKDSISLTITSTQAKLYMETNSQDLTPTFSNKGAEHTVTINDLGQAGQHTITYNFQLQADFSLQQVPVEIELSAHQIQPLQLTSLKAHTAFNAQLQTTDT